MKTLFSTLLLAFAVVMISCGPKAPKAEEAVEAPATEVVAPAAEEVAPAAAPATEEVVVDKAAKKAE